MLFRQTISFFALAIFTFASLTGCSSDPAQSTTGSVPLADAAAKLPYPEIWKNFQQLTQIPRPSHHEEKISAFMVTFGKSLGLETTVDSVGNVIIRKPATTGMENRPGVVLQAHLDMVPQKTTASKHNFETDPISAFVLDGWVHAVETTLGADDGIGVAIIMTLLQSKTISHGPLEALFTVNEEDGFTGVNALAATALRGRIFINVDNEDEGQFCISSAGGVYVDIKKVYAEVTTPTGLTGLQVTIDGLTGGHSGVDIVKRGGSAHQLMARLLLNAPPATGVRLASLAGGDRSNAIPRTTAVIVALPADQSAPFEKYVKEFAATVKSELAATDPALTVTVTSTGVPSKVMDATEQQALIGAVFNAPQGVYKMSSSIPGMVETSGNIGVLSITGGQFAATIYVRSAIDSERDAEAKRFATVFESAGATATLSGAYSSWPPNSNSAILAIMKQTYTTLFSKDATAIAIHAGLETSVVGVKYPDMDMIAIGPTLKMVHTPDERLEVASVPKVYDLILATLKNIH